MHTRRNPMIVWTAVLALMLAACGGGGSSLRVISPTDRQEEKVVQAIQDARRAIRALGGSDGSTYTGTDFENARTGIAAARNALKGADALSASARAERSAAIGTHGTIPGGLTRWTIGGVEAETAATWSGQFHEADLDRTPTVATGSFDAVHGDIGRMTGAFGTARQ